MIKSYLVPNESSSLWDFNTALIDYNATNPILKNILPSSLLMMANFNSSTSLNYSKNNGSLSASAFGGANATGGKLNLVSGAYVRYAGLNNASAAIQTGTVEFKATPAYVTTPANQSVLFIIHQAEANFANMVRIDHLTNGHITVYFYNSSGVSEVAQDMGLWVPTVGQAHKFSLNWNVNASGQIRLFIDGEQFGPTISAAFTRSSSVGIVQIGYDTLFSYVGSIDDFAIFDTVQHTTDYTPADTTTYSTTSPSIKLITPEAISKINSLSFNIMLPTGTDIRYTINVNDVRKYWNGSAWANSSGAGQSNQYNELTSTELEQLLTESSDVQYEVYLVSNGDETPMLFSFTSEFESIETARLFGRFIYQDKSIPTAEGTKVTAKPIKFYAITGENIQVSNGKEFTANFDPDTGNWDFPTLITRITYEVTFYDGKKIVSKVPKKVMQTGELPFS